MRSDVRLSLWLFLVVALPTIALADKALEHTSFGHDITVGPNEEVVEVTCFGCSVRVRGHVASDVTVFGGSILIEDQGQIGGDAVVFGGGMRLDRAAKVGGDVTVFGGRIHRDADASVGGDVTNFGGTIWLVVIFGLPLVWFGAMIALIVWLVRRLMRSSVPVTA